MPDVLLTKMHREEPAHPGGPSFQDVHPDNVAEMLSFGWVIVDAPTLVDDDLVDDDLVDETKPLAKKPKKK